MIHYDSDDELDHFEVIAQAEGVICSRRDVTITEAAAILRAEAAANAEPVSATAAAIVYPLRERTTGAPQTDDHDPD